MSEMQKLEFASEQKAIELLQQGDYYTDLQILDMLGEKAHDRANEFLNWIDEVKPDRRSIAIHEYRDKFNIALSLLRERTECYDILYGPERFWGQAGMYFRVKANTVFHLGKALRTITTEGLSLFVAYTASTSLSPLFQIWFGFTLIDLGRKLLSCYEKLEEPIEKLVFETVYKLENQYSVVNYDALEAKNFDQAYDKVSPTTKSICQELPGEIERKQIERILYDLKRRNILDERSDRWSIRFW